MIDDINLLPRAFLERELLRTRLRQWSVVWLATVALGGLAAAWVHANGRQLRQEASDLERQCEPIRDLVKTRRELQRELSEFNGRQTLLAELEQSQRPVQLLGIVSRCAGATGQRLHVEQLQLTQETVAVAPAPAPAKDKNVKTAATPALPPKRRLVLTGLATDDLAVARFLAELRGAAVFESVDLAATTRVAHLAGHAQHYEVHCHY